MEDALRLGCVGIGYTIYPGSSQRNRMYEDLRQLILEAAQHNLEDAVEILPFADRAGDLVQQVQSSKLRFGFLLGLPLGLEVLGLGLQGRQGPVLVPPLPQAQRPRATDDRRLRHEARVPFRSCLGRYHSR